jgi:GlpG protein
VVTLLHWSHVPQVGWLFADRDPIWDRQLWRLLTTVFPHLHPIHLAFNLIMFWRFGKVTEQWMGSLRFAGFFAATGVASSAAEVLAGSSGAGLSGVVYALFGFMYALRHDQEFAAEQMTPNVVTTMVGWFFLCIALTYADILAVGNYAHGAGAVVGWLFGQAVLSRRQAVATGLVSLLCLALGLATLYMPWDGYYDWHRATACAEQKDYAGALKWYQRAAQRLSGENQERARHNARWAEYMLQHGDEDGQ